jgi:hypothetical protein
MPFLLWFSTAISCVGLFLMGTIEYTGIYGNSTSYVSLSVFMVGILINGGAAALSLNHGVAATVQHLRSKYQGAGETVNNITSGLFVFYFSLGEMIGPIYGSILSYEFGNFSGAVMVLNIVMVCWALITFYHLAGPAFFKLKVDETPQYASINEEGAEPETPISAKKL